MIIKTALCDDMPDIRAQVLEYFREMEQEDGIDFEIQEFCCAEELEEKLADDTRLLILDILMGGRNGIEAAHRLRQKNPELCIIFITSATQFAVEGYSVRAFGFLEKPLQYDSFRREIRDAIAMVIKKYGTYITLNNGKTKDILQTDHIIYIEVYKHTLHIATINGHSSYTTSLSSVETMLEGLDFFRCHKSFLIHLKHVKNIRPTEVEMSNGDTVPLSKHRRREMLNAMTAYMGGHNR